VSCNYPFCCGLCRPIGSGTGTRGSRGWRPTTRRGLAPRFRSGRGDVGVRLHVHRHTGSHRGRGRARCVSAGDRPACRTNIHSAPTLACAHTPLGRATTAGRARPRAAAACFAERGCHLPPRANIPPPRSPCHSEAEPAAGPISFDFVGAAAEEEGAEEAGTHVMPCSPLAVAGAAPLCTQPLKNARDSSTCHLCD
jgi:hypothetical protein